MKRRNFIEFIGKGSLAGIVLSPLSLLNSCATAKKIYKAKILFDSLEITEKIDDVVLAEGFVYNVVVSAGDKISDKDTFGEHNDYIACFISKNNETILWVNNEYYNPLFLGTDIGDKTREQIDIERYAVGGSIIKIEKDEYDNWKLKEDNAINKRITGETKIPFLWNEKIAGSDFAEGTLENCAGGITSWGTVLSCEENYDYQYGDIYYDENNERQFDKSWAGWEKFYNNPPEHYGWVVEVDIETGEAQKLVALGRFKHESATVFELEDGRVVIYSGDDEKDQHIYKYVSKKPQDLQDGTLYVADMENGKWLSLDYNHSKILQNRFKNQTDVLIRTREAAKLLGATPMNRPEDIDIDPISGDVYISLTNNTSKGDFHGTIIKIIEDTEDKTGLTFKSETFLTGGEENMFSSPDNLAFDKRGNLWFCTDVSESKLGTNEYEKFVSNGLFLVPRTGKKAGEIIQIASAPNDSEFTGIFFHPNENTLFLSVQHPGDNSKDLLNLTSHWPLGRNSLPKSSVIAISGNSMNKLLN